MATEERLFREFLETYNRIVEECFNRCIFSFNYRYLLDEEVDCISRCTSRYVNYNQRIAMNFAKIQAKKMFDAEEQILAEQNATTVNNATATNSRPS